MEVGIIFYDYTIAQGGDLPPCWSKCPHLEALLLRMNMSLLTTTMILGT